MPSEQTIRVIDEIMSSKNSHRRFFYPMPVFLLFLPFLVLGLLPIIAIYAHLQLVTPILVKATSSKFLNALILASSYFATFSLYHPLFYGLEKMMAYGGAEKKFTNLVNSGVFFNLRRIASADVQDLSYLEFNALMQYFSEFKRIESCEYFLTRIQEEHPELCSILVKLGADSNDFPGMENRAAQAVGLNCKSLQWLAAKSINVSNLDRDELPEPIQDILGAANVYHKSYLTKIKKTENDDQQRRVPSLAISFN